MSSVWPDMHEAHSRNAQKMVQRPSGARWLVAEAGNKAFDLCGNAFLTASISTSHSFYEIHCSLMIRYLGSIMLAGLEY